MFSHVGPHSRHWEYFVLLEQDLERASRFVEFTEDNFDTYSVEFAHVLFSAAAESEVMMKRLCGFFQPGKEAENIGQCRDILLDDDDDPDNRRLQFFWRIRVGLPRFGLVLQPWAGWRTKKGTLPWWGDYNKVKHERHRQFQRANLRNALNAVAALFLLVLEYESWDKTHPGPKKRILDTLPGTARVMVPPARIFYLDHDCGRGSDEDQKPATDRHKQPSRSASSVK